MGSGNYLLAILFDKPDPKRPGLLNFVCVRCLTEEQSEAVCKWSDRPEDQTPIFERDWWFAGADCIRCDRWIPVGGC